MSEVNREVANLTEKKIYIPLYMVSKNLSVCLLHFTHFYEILGLQKTSYISKISTPFRVKMVKWVYLDNYKAEVKFSTRTQLPRLGAIWHIGMSGTLYAADLGSIIDGL